MMLVAVLMLIVFYPNPPGPGARDEDETPRRKMGKRVPTIRTTPSTNRM